MSLLRKAIAFHRERAAPMSRALRALSRQESVSLVQIGAFVGDTDNDPLAKFIRNICVERGEASVVIFVEPIRAYFDRLRQNYAGLSGIHFENDAVAESTGIRDFFRLGVDPADYGYPPWLARLGSLKPERMRTLWERYERNSEYQKFFLQHQVVEKVECVTLDSLLKKHGIVQLDLSQIDADGHDYEILRTIDFTRICPRYIN